jgi:hypothetical protein
MLSGVEAERSSVIGNGRWLAEGGITLRALRRLIECVREVVLGRFSTTDRCSTLAIE